MGSFVGSILEWLVGDTGLGPAGARMSGLGLIAFCAMLASGVLWMFVPEEWVALAQVLFFSFLGLWFLDIAFWALPPKR